MFIKRFATLIIPTIFTYSISFAGTISMLEGDDPFLKGQDDESNILHYSCTANRGEIYHGLGADEKMPITKDGISRINLNLQLIYRPLTNQFKHIVGDNGYSKQLKPYFFLFGEYTNLFDGSATSSSDIGIRRHLDVHVMGIAPLQQVKDYATIDNSELKGTNFSAISAVLGINKKVAKKVTRSNDYYFIGGTYNNSEQMNILDFVTSAISEENVWARPQSMVMAQVPQMFARLDAEPNSFYMSMTFTHLAEAVLTPSSNPHIKHKLALKCVRMKDLNHEEVEQILSHSNTLEQLEDQEKQVLHRDSSQFSSLIQNKLPELHSAMNDSNFVIKSVTLSMTAYTLWTIFSKRLNPVLSVVPPDIINQYLGRGVRPLIIPEHERFDESYLRSFLELNSDQQMKILEEESGLIQYLETVHKSIEEQKFWYDYEDGNAA